MERKKEKTFPSSGFYGFFWSSGFGILKLVFPLFFFFFSIFSRQRNLLKGKDNLIQNSVSFCNLTPNLSQFGTFV